MRRMAIVGLMVSVALLGVLAWQAIGRQREYRRLVAEGDRALNAGQTFVALESYSGAIALRNDVMIAYLKRGETYRQRGEYGEALRDLRTAARLDPTATKPLEMAGDVNATLEHYERAAERYEAFLKLDDRSPRVLYKLALARHRLGHTSEALAPLRQALAVDEWFAPGHYLLGVCLHALNQLPEATAALERAVRLDSGSPAPPARNWRRSTATPTVTRRRSTSWKPWPPSNPAGPSGSSLSVWPTAEPAVPTWRS